MMDYGLVNVDFDLRHGAGIATIVKRSLVDLNKKSVPRKKHSHEVDFEV
jgi:hypothetical protein